jgi:hypothetical protein
MAAKRKKAKKAPAKTVKRTGKRGPARFNARTQVEFLAGAVFTLKAENEKHVESIKELQALVAAFPSPSREPLKQIEDLEDTVDLLRLQVAEQNRRFFSLAHYLEGVLGFSTETWDAPATQEPVATPAADLATPSETATALAPFGLSA